MGIPRVLSPKIIFLVGPTAVGKSAVAIALARRLHAEIISCDSMQVYRRMDILNSMPSLRERVAVLHHRLDFLEPTRSYNVSRYRREALRCMNDIHERGKPVIFTGGTGLYVSILLDGLFTVKGIDQKYRESLYAIAQKRGSALLHKKLREVDPVAAGKIHPNDARRIIRALEVYKVTGKPISLLQGNRQGLWGKYPIRLFCLTMDREDLYRRINARVDAMFRKGVIEEVEKLRGMRLSKTASCAIGIREVGSYLKGESDINTVKELMKRNTRWYAKRQLTWFRKDTRISWLHIDNRETPVHIAGRIIKEL
ncbi:MAG TPA: tRNA (adenosine(37)-N6)-dimethylallyltransferase MiaA [Candidatus Omnitrophota bacterium]|nr:tRNA (adenosine(37)-N6)-dimethylallyltransferase MiaA [Candidatus Omnitrophota bacterium]